MTHFDQGPQKIHHSEMRGQKRQNTGDELRSRWVLGYSLRLCLWSTWKVIVVW